MNLSRETKVYMTDSGEQNTTKYNYLPGGVISIIRGKSVSLI